MPPTESADHLLTFAADLARRAGALIVNQRPDQLAVDKKGRIDLVTEMDLRSEELIVETIRNRFPKHEILAEEGGRREGVGGNVLWLVDPIDGTTNYTHGYPCYCVSIAAEIDGVVAAGAVYDPNRDEIFTALRDEGAWLNGQAISVSEAEELEEALLATGFAYGEEEIRRNLELFCRIMKRSRAVRRDGSAALDLCYVGCGRFDGFWELSLNPWDVAAAGLVVREAGGVVTRMDGRPTTIYTPEILATNGRLHDVLSRCLAGWE